MVDDDHRAAHRRRVLKEGRIVTNWGGSTLDCVVRDLSDGGARLKVENALAVPEAFDLFLVQEEVSRPARVMWRRGREVGVRFPVEGAGPAA